ncbi:hypothetical protein ACFL1E_07865, partial [Candidatus Omnitrophota bacterium]
MEKRTFLAIALSLVVLFVYQSYVAKTKHAANKEDTEKTASFDSKPAVSPSVVQATAPSFPVQAEQVFEPISDEEYVMEASGLKLTFSKIGGLLKEIHLTEFDSSLPQMDISS